MEPALFSKEGWDADPVAAFSVFVRSEAFVATGRKRNRVSDALTISAESAEIYLFMFNKFARLLASSGKRFSQVSQDDIHRFLQQGMSQRSLRLLVRCYQHLGITDNNPADKAGYDLFKRGEKLGNQATVVLTDEEFSRFLNALPVHQVKYPRGGFLNGWKRRRDRAMQLTMACAGLSVAEVIGLLLQEVSPIRELDGTLKISIEPEGKHATSYAHDALLRAEAVDEFLQWADERVKLAIPGGLAFPANEDGEPLSKATVYRQVAATCKRAGITGRGLGGRTLRNTFAVQELRNGLSEAELAGQLGLADERSAATYIKAKGNPV